MSKRETWAFLVGFSAIALGCDGGTVVGTGGSGGSGATTGTGASNTGGTGGSASLNGECPSDKQVGNFYIQNETDYSVVAGEVLTGVVPSKVTFEVGAEGDCKLLQRKNPFCDPACKSDQACAHDGTCVPYPLPQDAGQVTISGLTKPVNMAFPSYFDTAVDHPPFTPGGNVTLKAQGATYPGFTLHGEGFAPMDFSSDMLVIKTGEPLSLSWTPDNSSSLATVRVRINIDQHGNSPVELTCELADTGSTVIPSSLIDQLINFGVTGFPSAHVVRHTLDSVSNGDQCVQFEVYSHRLAAIQVAGHIPCDPVTPCPMGMTCDIPTGTCL
ncbi:MAG: hypothetical protein IPK82_38185 [Polyangiaceae bacterium]|nr:hypothetical protein [Polyangiaceae bacterium]